LGNPAKPCGLNLAIPPSSTSRSPQHGLTFCLSSVQRPARNSNSPYSPLPPPPLQPLGSKSSIFFPFPFPPLPQCPHGRSSFSYWRGALCDGFPPLCWAIIMFSFPLLVCNFASEFPSKLYVLLLFLCLRPRTRILVT